MCHFVCEEVLSGAFEEVLRWWAWAVRLAGYSVLVHGRLCGWMQHEAERRVKHCIGFSSWRVVHCVGGGSKLNGGYIV